MPWLSFSCRQATLPAAQAHPEHEQVAFLKLGRNDNLSVHGSLRIPFSKKPALTANGRLSYVWLEGMLGGTDYRNQGVQGMGYMYLTYAIEKDWRISANTGFYSATALLQGTTNPYLYSSLSVSKELFKKRGDGIRICQYPFPGIPVHQHESGGS